MGIYESIYHMEREREEVQQSAKWDLIPPSNRKSWIISFHSMFIQVAYVYSSRDILVILAGFHSFSHVLFMKWKYGFYANFYSSSFRI